jgi:hypothetical protein
MQVADVGSFCVPPNHLIVVAVHGVGGSSLSSAVPWTLVRMTFWKILINSETLRSSDLMRGQ